MLHKNLILSLFITLFILSGCGGGSTSTSTSNERITSTKVDTVSTDTNTQEQAEEETPTQVIPDKNLKTIELLILVDAEDQNSFNGINDTKIDHFISVSNTVYANSAIDVKLKINKIQPYHFNEGKSEEVLYDIFSDENISTLRNEAKADLVVIYRKYVDDGSCGVAFINNQLNKEVGYAHVSLECPSTTTAHEIGHTMGLTHSEHKASGKGLFNYARGYGVDGEFVTIMAYQSTYNTNKRVFNYSNPKKDCLGFECGVNDELANGANAVKALRYAVDYVSDFR